MQRCVDTPSTTRLRRSVLVPESPTLEAQSVPEVARAGAPVASSVGLQIAIMFMGSTLLTPLYPLYQHEFGFSEVMLTLVYAAYAVGNLVALFLFGRVSDQIGRRRTSLPALALGAVASLIFLCANATPWLFVGRALSGLAIGVAAAAATAWAVELLRDETRASALATVANMLGVAIGPLLAGLLAQFAPAPLRTSHIVYLLLLAVVAWHIAALPETVREALPRWRDASFRPRVGVPREVRGAFVAPALAGFATFALAGYYAALVPGLLAERLGLASPVISGAIVAALYGIAAVAIALTRSLRSGSALRGGVLLLLPSAALLVLTQTTASMAAMLGATLFGGVALALGYRGTLQVVNAIAPDAQRAEVVASYMIACFLGNALPVIGIAVLSQVAGATAASVVFACVLAGLGTVAFVVNLRSAHERA
jgi:MFS family permease